MTIYRCPTTPNAAQVAAGETDPVVGCGAVFEAWPDHEGLVDCPHCGIWFRHDEDMQ